MPLANNYEWLDVVNQFAPYYTYAFGTQGQDFNDEQRNDTIARLQASGMSPQEYADWQQKQDQYRNWASSQLGNVQPVSQTSGMPVQDIHNAFGSRFGAGRQNAAVMSNYGSGNMLNASRTGSIDPNFLLYIRDYNSRQMENARRGGTAQYMDIEGNVIDTPWLNEQGYALPADQRPEMPAPVGLFSGPQTGGTDPVVDVEQPVVDVAQQSDNSAWVTGNDDAQYGGRTSNTPFLDAYNRTRNEAQSKEGSVMRSLFGV
jgi:hypothetical protein